jgi:hypothetical protein
VITKIINPNMDQEDNTASQPLLFVLLGASVRKERRMQSHSAKSPIPANAMKRIGMSKLVLSPI